jgi:hypothetical protein
MNKHLNSERIGKGNCKLLHQIISIITIMAANSAFVSSSLLPENSDNQSDIPVYPGCGIFRIDSFVPRKARTKDCRIYDFCNGHTE